MRPWCSLGLLCAPVLTRGGLRLRRYETWKEAQGSSTKGWAIKYYKVRC